MDLDEGNKICKRSIGGKSITVRMQRGGDREMEDKNGTDLRAQFLELRDFEKQWSRMWQLDE